MNSPIGNNNKKEFWLHHLAEAAKFSGTKAEYCRQNNLVKSRFTYYRDKYSKPANFSEVRAVEKVAVKRAAVEKSIYPQTVDAKWVAELIRELHR